MQELRLDLAMVGDGGPFGFIAATVAALVLIAAWVILAASRFTQGGIVERPERVPQLYGYTVCLIAIIWAITSLLSIVGSTLALSAPELHGESGYGLEPSVTSFEAFRTTYDRARRFASGDPRDAQLDSVPEVELRRRYDVIRADHVRRVQYQSRRDIIIGTLSLVIAAALFVFHWRWLRRRAWGGGAEAAAAGAEPSRPRV